MDPSFNAVDHPLFVVFITRFIICIIPLSPSSFASSVFPPFTKFIILCVIFYHHFLHVYHLCHPLKHPYHLSVVFIMLFIIFLSSVLSSFIVQHPDHCVRNSVRSCMVASDSYRAEVIFVLRLAWLVFSSSGLAGEAFCFLFVWLGSVFSSSGLARFFSSSGLAPWGLGGGFFVFSSSGLARCSLRLAWLGVAWPLLFSLRLAWPKKPSQARRREKKEAKPCRAKPSPTKKKTEPSQTQRKQKTGPILIVSSAACSAR